MFIFGVVGLVCQYHSQVIGQKPGLVLEMTYYVLILTLNFAHLLSQTSCVFRQLMEQNRQLCGPGLVQELSDR